MRMGVLDIGSNTGHLLIVDAYRGGPPLPAYSFKEPLRLAEQLGDDNCVTDDGVARLVKYVGEAKAEALERGCSSIVAFATSAVRDADNADAVLAAVHAATGVDLRVLDTGRTHEELRLHARSVIADVAGPLLRGGHFDRAVATSKTFRSLARMCGAASSSEGQYVRRVLRRSDLRPLISEIVHLDVEEIAQLPGVSHDRAHQMVAGAVVAEAAMDLFGVDELEICPWALREGVLLEHLAHL